MIYDTVFLTLQRVNITYLEDVRDFLYIYTNFLNHLFTFYVNLKAWDLKLLAVLDDNDFSYIYAYLLIVNDDHILFIILG